MLHKLSQAGRKGGVAVFAVWQRFQEEMFKGRDKNRAAAHQGARPGLHLGRGALAR